MKLAKLVKVRLRHIVKLTDRIGLEIMLNYSSTHRLLGEFDRLMYIVTNTELYAHSAESHCSSIKLTAIAWLENRCSNIFSR